MRHTSYWRDWSSDVCSSDLRVRLVGLGASLVLVLTGIGGMGTALAQEEVNLNVAAACFNVGVDDRGGENAQSINVAQGNRSEERRVGKEFRSRWWTYH